MFLGLQHFGGRRACWSSGMRTRKSDKHHLLTWTYTNQTISWLVHNLNIFGAWMSHEQTQTHKTHHSLDLGEATTFPLIVYFVPCHGTSTQMAFCHATPKWESRNSQSWDFRKVKTTKGGGAGASTNTWGPLLVCNPIVEFF
jgi:hypothetical protein